MNITFTEDDPCFPPLHCGLFIISNMEFLFSWVTNMYICIVQLENIQYTNLDYLCPINFVPIYSVSDVRRTAYIPATFGHSEYLSQNVMSFSKPLGQPMIL